jgi:hypothetical protein
VESCGAFVLFGEKVGENLHQNAAPLGGGESH